MLVLRLWRASIKSWMRAVIMWMSCAPLVHWFWTLDPHLGSIWERSGAFGRWKLDGRGLSQGTGLEVSFHWAFSLAYFLPLLLWQDVMPSCLSCFPQRDEISLLRLSDGIKPFLPWATSGWVSQQQEGNFNRASCPVAVTFSLLRQTPDQKQLLGGKSLFQPYRFQGEEAAWLHCTSIAERQQPLPALAEAEPHFRSGLSIHPQEHLSRALPAGD